ncbi:MAG: M1 family metallopeptidase [Candidatus Micrarchaeaceae archaeon]
MESSSSSKLIIPMNYSISIEPDREGFSFKGNVSIEANAVKKTRRISLDAKELELFSAHVASHGKEQIAKILVSKKDETATLLLRRPVYGPIRISIDYRGTHNSKMYGFYRSEYYANGKKKYILTTQFEPTDARAAFPCFDRPDLKATFDVSITIKKNLSAISNMPIKREDYKGDKKTVRFYRTPKMSTYLLYMGVGEFKFLQGTLGGTTIRVAATGDKIKYGKLALNFAKESLRYYQNYLGIKFPLPKLDLIAVPDFAAGAMENWGAITFREVDLLADEKLTSVADMQNIARIIAHEIAHQWFGDLVTMRWWDDLWLNESFATYMSSKAINATHPGWDEEIEYTTSTLSYALSFDELRNTHPINVAVRTPEEIESIFDGISYEKGGSVLRMLEAYAGSAAFRAGLHLYLKRHSYSNATKQDLWAAVQNASLQMHGRKGIMEFMSHWINTPGYPVVVVEQGRNGIKLVQKKHTISVESKPRSAWPLPIEYISERGEGSIFIDSRTARLKIRGWVKLNKGQLYLYRVHYPKPMLDEIGRKIKEKKIGSIDGWGIENDLFDLARSGKIEIREYLDFITRYMGDSEYPANASILSHLMWLLSASYGKKYYTDVAYTLQAFSNNVLGGIGWRAKSDEKPSISKLRNLALLASGFSGNSRAVKTATELFAKAYSNKKVDPNIKGAVYALAAWSGGRRIYKRLLEMYNRANLPDEKVHCIRAIGKFKDKALLKSALALSLSKSIRPQDSYIIHNSVSANPVGKKIIWGWTKKNWKTLMSRYSGAGNILRSFITDLASISSEREREDIVEFFSKKSNMRSVIRRAFKQTLELIDANIRLAEQNK